MTRILLLLVAAVALVGAVLWFASSAGEPRGVRGPEVASAPKHEEDAAPAELAEPADEPASSEPVESTGREPVDPSREAGGAASTWIEGRVLFPANTPADEEVFVVARGKNLNDGESLRVKVGRDGVFRFSVGEKARKGILELTGRYLYLAENVKWRSPASKKPLVIRPELGARIVGHVHPPSGKTRVVGQLVLRSSQQEEDRRDLSPQLDFAFNGLVPGEDAGPSYELQLDGADFLGRSGKLAPEAGRTLEVELELTPGIVLSGIVRGENGALLTGAKIQAFSDSGSWTSANHRSTQSGVDGSFRLGALPGGRIRLQAEFDGFEPLVRELGRIEAGRAVPDLELVLSPGLTIAGTVLWPDGSPAAATLELTPLPTFSRRSLVQGAVEGTCDLTGAFRIRGLSEGSYRVTARAAKPVETPAAIRNRSKQRGPEWSAVSESVAAGTADLVLTLAPGLTLEGRVVDELGVPLANFSVSAGRVQSSFANAGGAFELKDLVAGNWDLRAKSKGHADSEAVHVTLPGAGPVVLVAPREAVVGGLVLDPSGASLARASVRIQSDGWSLPFGTELHGDSLVADENGHFELGRLGPGKLALQASGPGFAPNPPQIIELQAGDACTDLVLRLRNGGTILGELIGSNGRPRAGQVTIGGQGFEAFPEADADGRFQAVGVPPGEIDLWAETSEGIELQTRVTMREGDTLHVRLAPQGKAVRLFGHVRAGGEPLAEASLWADRKEEEGDASAISGRSSSRTDADGAYEMILPGPGRYWLGVEGGDERSFGWRVTLDVPSVEAYEFDTSIPLGRITGRVTDTERRALARILVQSEPGNHEGGAHGSAEGRTDDEGRYELLVPAGNHSVRAGGAGGWTSDAYGSSEKLEQPYAETRVEGLVVAENDTLRGIDLVLTKGGTLEGVARRADGSSARVQLWSEEGLRPRVIGTTDESGHFSLDGLPPGTLVLGARGRTLSTRESVRVPITAGETKRVELELVSARLVHIRVRQRGVPVGSEIQVLDARSQPQPVETQENGEAWAGPLVPGRYVIRSERDQRRVEHVLDLAEGEGEVTLELVFE